MKPTDRPGPPARSAPISRPFPEIPRIGWLRPTGIALTYLAFGALWILVTDRLVTALLGDAEILASLQTIKGLAFVGLSSLVVYWLAAKAARRTGEQHAGAQLRLADGLVSATLASEGEAVFIVEPDTGRIVRCNRAAEVVFGFAPGELVGQSVGRLHVEEQPFEELMARARPRLEDSGWFRTRSRMCSRDGSQLETEHVVTALDPSAGWRGGVVLVVRDLTEQTRTQTALARQEEQLRLLANLSLDIIWSMDLELRFLNVSDAARNLLGYDPAEVIGTPLDRYLEPSEYDRVRTLIQERVAAFDAIPGALLLETSLIHRDGSAVPVEIHAMPSRGPTGTPIGMQGSARDIRQRVESASQLRQMVHRLQCLRRIDQSISAMTPLELLLHRVALEVREATGCDAVQIVRLVEPDHHLASDAVVGFRTSLPDGVILSPDEGLIGRTVIGRKAVMVSDVQDAGSGFARPAIALAEGLRGFACAPMIVHGKVVGAVAAFRRTPGGLTSDELAFLESAAERAALGVAHVQNFLALQTANEGLLLAYDATIAGWSRALDYRDHETEGHSQRVTAIAVELARRAGLEDARLRHVKWGALLHDIGKMGVPDTILRKPGPLTAEERAVIERHPIIARNLLQPIKYLEPAIAIPFGHHEWWDGTGYPQGVAGDLIPLEARLFALADVWDAMRSPRPYRDGWTEARVIDDIRSRAGSQFDPALVALFLRAMREIPECRSPAYVAG